MWKLFEKAFGRTGTAEPEQDSGRKQDSGFQASPESGSATRGDGSGNGGAVPRVTDQGGALKENAEEPATREAQPATAVANPELEELENKVKAAMRTVYDPEIPINIYELGLIYGLQVEPEGKVQVQMTLTAPSCPEAQVLPARVQNVIQEVPGVTEATVELVWEPPWTPKRMTDAARLQLGIF